jgi:outer membrane protein assembly factor BamA
MMVRWLIAAVAGGVLFVGCGLRAAFGNESAPASRGRGPALLEAPARIIDEIEFAGLRHISPDAVRAQISSRAGARLDLNRVEADVKVLGRLGWFGGIWVETQPAKSLSPVPLESAIASVRLVFHVEELPFLAKVEYTGSRMLSPAQIEKTLADKQLAPRLGEPADPAVLLRIANTIRTALAELAHPQPGIQIRRENFANGTVCVRFAIEDGPHIPVGRIDFEGHTEVSPKLLQHEMRRTAPDAFFATWRGKGAYTREGFEEDRSRILIYYQDHGFPEARIGTIHTSVYEKKSSRWMPRPLRTSGKRLAIAVPVEAGSFYRLASVVISPELAVRCRVLG